MLIHWRAVDASLESCFIPNARILFVHDRSKIPYSIHRQISDVYGYKAFLRQAVSNYASCLKVVEVMFKMRVGKEDQ